MAEVPQFTVNLAKAWIKLCVSKAKAASGRADGFGYTRSLDSCEDSPALLELMCAQAHSPHIDSCRPFIQL